MMLQLLMHRRHDDFFVVPPSADGSEGSSVKTDKGWIPQWVNMTKRGGYGCHPITVYPLLGIHSGCPQRRLLPLILFRRRGFASFHSWHLPISIRCSFSQTFPPLTLIAPPHKINLDFTFSFDSARITRLNGRSQRHRNSPSRREARMASQRELPGFCTNSR